MNGRPTLKWKIADPMPDHEGLLAAGLGLSPLTARMLALRGIRTPDQGASFLHPKLSDLADPMLMKDMDRATARIREAVFKKQRIAVYGDFDADGVTSTALLVRFLRLVGADVEAYIPDRISEGYGLNAGAIDKLAAAGSKLLVTVDCGITACSLIERAVCAGMDVVVTDHHEPPPELPRCCAVIDPKRGDETYPYRDLAGVGVVFKLVWALARDISPSGKLDSQLKAFLFEALGLVAIGTVADVVPLTGENRVLVKNGLSVLERTKMPGERAMLSVAGTDAPDAADLAFRLGPRLNAAGRLGDATAGLDVLLADSFEKALEGAKKLDRINRKRQEIEKDILAGAMEQVLSAGLQGEPALVLDSEDWHPGVIGIVASKLVDAFSRPAVLIAFDGGIGRASARSVPGFNLHGALSRCSRRLLSFGGHSQAAGFTIRREDLEPFRAEFLRAASADLVLLDLAPSIDVEAEIELRDVNSRWLAELALFKPFGVGNPEPVFAVRNGVVAGKPRSMGSAGKHLSFYFRHGDSARRAVAFGLGDMAASIERARVDMAFALSLNRFRGTERVELHVKDLRVL